MGRTLNPNRAKLHRSYTVEEVAELLCVHKNTIRGWIKNELPVCDDQRPTLILGRDLREFIRARNQSRKRSCRPWEMYCMRCRSPQQPAGNKVDYEAITARTGRLTGICATCKAVINKYTSLDKLILIRGKLDLALTKAQKHIVDRDDPLVNSDFK